MNLQKINGQKSVFETIKQINQNGQEFWYARDFQNILEYKEWRKFSGVIGKAKEACINSGQSIADHFVPVDKMIEIGRGGQRKIDDIKLSRYACYLIVQNADPSKPVVALGQTYFAIQTRRQELIEQADYENLRTENEKRLFLRNQLKDDNKKLAGAAKGAGVITALDYAIFQDHGYKGLYTGLGAKEIHHNKGLKKGQEILDHMGSSELAANWFRVTQAEEKIKRENIKGKDKANVAHFEVGKKVRRTIKELGGTMPEQLPVPESIKKLKKSLKKIIKIKKSKIDVVGFELSGVTKGKISLREEGSNG